MVIRMHRISEKSAIIVSDCRSIPPLTRVAYIASYYTSRRPLTKSMHAHQNAEHVHFTTLEI
jgi:hypothetical protein